MSENNKISSAAAGFSSLPMQKQIGLLLGVSASIAIGVGIALWSKDPNYLPLYSNLSPQQAGEIADALQSSGIEYKFDTSSGSVLVSSDNMYKAKIKLANEGLPGEKGFGLEILKNESGIGTSQFMESARYKHALEIELSRTIANFANIKNARVHLAIPKSSSFMRKEKKPTASIFVDVYRSSTLQRNQVKSIIHLVASSIPEMKTSDVSVVDQDGKLLSSVEEDTALGMAGKQLEYKQSFEQIYAKKVSDILTPLVGVGKVKARVNATIDYTSKEQTTESFNPENVVVRSEQGLTESKNSSLSATGVPGAASNQAPQAGELNENARISEKKSSDNESKNSRKQFVKNYELDKTISHIRNNPGTVNRISVAVLIDNISEYDAESGESTSRSLTDKEIQKIELLVKDTVGFDKARGDSVNIVNIPFTKRAPIVDDMPAQAMWEQAWFWEIAKQIMAGLFIVFMVLGLLRPLLRNLSTHNQVALQAANNQVEHMNADGPIPTALQGSHALQNLDSKEKLLIAQNMATKDPERVASIMKNWVGE